MWWRRNSMKLWGLLLAAVLGTAVAAEDLPPAASPGKPSEANQAESKQADKEQPAASGAKSSAGEQPPAKKGKLEKKQGEAKRDEAKVGKGKKTDANAERSADVAADREAAALAFVAEHHPELTGLLAPLKNSDPKEYQKAIRELYQASERLRNLKEKSPTRYPLELELWKLGSRVRLLAARMTMGPNPELERELRDVIGLQIQTRLELLRVEKAELESRLQRLSANLETTEKTREELVQKSYDKVLRDVGKARPVARQPAKKAAKAQKAEAKQQTPTESK